MPGDSQRSASSTRNADVDLDADVDGLVEQYDEIVEAVKEADQPRRRVEDLDAIRRELDSRVGYQRTIALLLEH